MNPNPAGNTKGGLKRASDWLMKHLNGFFNSGMIVETPSKAQPQNEPKNENVQPQGGFVQPQGGFAPQQGGFAQPQGGFAPQQGGFAQPQGGFAQPQGGFVPQSSGFAPQPSGFAQPQGGFTPQNGYARPTPNAFAPQPSYAFGVPPQQNGFVPPPQTGTPPVTYDREGGNIAYIHNEAQQTFSHVARILHITKRIECRVAIGYMQNEESVLLNMESITDEAEVKRCVDILYGAAFAMGARFAKVCEHGVYLISPSSLRLISDKPTNVQQRDPSRGTFTPVSSARQGSRFEDVAAYAPSRDLRVYSAVAPATDGYAGTDARQAF